MSDNILVALRFRPLIEREITNGDQICWKVENSSDVYQVDPQTQKIPEYSSSVFKFDHVFDMKATNRDVYEKVAKPLVDSAVNGFNATIFAYGQTSSGKTHTMMGSKTELGVLQLVVNEIFDAIESNPDREYLLRVSFIEIYQEQITDLLTGSTRLKLSDAHNEVVIKELSEEMCSTPGSVLDVMKKGEKLRHIACTNMNDRSSRSHTIFRIIIESRSRCETGSGEVAIQVSHLNLVDLAGSEKVNQTGATGGRFKEGCAINISLSALGKVIDQLSKRERHVNFRDNKLTHILRNSLGGNARTAIICSISPASVDETLSTLRFATGAKSIMNKPVLNEVVNDKAMLKRYEKKIRDLQLQLQSGPNLNQSMVMLDVSALIEEKDRMIRELKEKLIVSTHDPTPKGWNATELERENRRKTWCPSSKNLKRLSFELPLADRSLNFQIPTSLHEESFDSRQFQLECLLEEDEDKSVILSPMDMQDRGRHIYNKEKDIGEVAMSVQTTSVENSRATPSAKTPVSRALSKSAGTPASELRSQMRSLVCRIKLIQEEYTLLENHYELLDKDYKELQEFTKFEKDFGVRDKWEKEQKLKIKDQLDLASEEIISLEKNNQDLEDVVSDLQYQIEWEREKRSRVLTSLQEETIKPLVNENKDLKKAIKEAEAMLTNLEKEKNDQGVEHEIIENKMKRQITELRASLEEAWGTSQSDQAHTGKELQLKLVLLQEEHNMTNEKLANQECTYKTDIDSLRNQLRVKESQILEEIAARQSAEALAKQLQLDLQGYTDLVSSASRGIKRISCSPIRQDTSVNVSLKQVQKKLKLEDHFDESTPSNLAETLTFDEIEVVKKQLDFLPGVIKEGQEKYNPTIQEKEDTIHYLSNKIVNLEKTVLDSKNHYEESKLQIEVLKSDIKTISHEKDALENELSEKTRLVVEISEEIKNRKISSESLTKLADDRLSEIKNLEKEIELTRCQLEKIEELKEVINTLQEELKSTKEASDTAMCLVADYETEIEEVKQSYENTMSEKTTQINLLEELTNKLKDEVKSCTEKLISKNEEVKSLQLSFESLKRVNESNQPLKEEVTELQIKLNETLIKIEELEGYVSSLQTEIKDLNIQKEHFEEELQILLDILDEKEGLINDEKNILGISKYLEICFSILKNEVFSLKANSKTLREENEQLLTMVQEKQKLSDDQEGLINNLKLRISDVEGQLQIQISSAENDKEKLIEGRSKLNEEIISLRKDLTVVQDENEQECLRFIECKKEFKIRLDAKIAEAESLQGKIEELTFKNFQVQELAKTLEETTTHYKAIQDDKLELNKEIEKLQSKLTESNFRAIEMAKTIEETLALSTALSEEKKKLATEITQLKTQVSDKTSIIDQLKNTLEETRNELKTVEAEMNSKSKEFENLSCHHTNEVDKKLNELAQVTKEKENFEKLLASAKEEVWGSSQSDQAHTGKELELKLVLLQEEHNMTNEKLANQECTYKTDIDSLRNQLRVKESQILEEIAARQSAEALAKQLQLDLQGYTDLVSSASRGIKRISCSPILQDTSVNVSLKQVQKELKLEDHFDESTPSNLAETLTFDEIEIVKKQLDFLPGVIKEGQEKYNPTIQEKEDTIHYLSNKIVNLEKTVLDSKNHYEESKLQIEVLKSDIKTISHEKDALENELSEKTRLVVEISEEIKNRKISSESLTKLADDRLSEIKNLEKEIELTRCQLEKIEELKEVINTLQEELKSTKEASDTAMCLVADYETEIEEVKQSYENTMSEKTTQINLLEELTNKLKDEVKSCTEKLISKNEEVKSLQLSFESLKRVNESNQPLKEEVTELQIKLNETLIKIEELEGYVSSLQTEIKDLNIQKEHFEEELKILLDILDEKEGLINDEKNILGSLNCHISELEGNLHVQVGEMELLKNSLNETTAQLSEARATNKEKVISKDLEMCFSILKNEVSSLKTNSKTLREENEQLLTMVQEKQKLSDDQEGLINNLKLRISDVEGQLQIQIFSAENDKEKLIEGRSKLNEEIMSLRKDLTVVQDEKEQESLRFIECEKEFKIKLDAKIAEAESLQVKIEELTFKNFQVQELAKTLEETTTHYKVIQDDKIELNKEIEKLQSKLTESNSSAIEMAKTIEETLALSTALSEEKKMLATEIAQLKTQVRDKTSISDQLKNALEETRNELKTVEAEMNSKSKEFENLSCHHAKEVDKKLNELAQVTKEKENFEKLLASTKEEVQRLQYSQDLFAGPNDEVHQIQEELTKKEKEMTNLQNKYDAVRLSYSNLEVQVTTLQQSLNSAGEIISNQKKDIGDLKLKMAEFDQVQDLLTDSALKIIELEKKVAMASDTEDDLKHLKTEFAVLESQRESALCALKEANLGLEIKSKVEEQCAAYKSQLDFACNQIQELENQAKEVEKLKSESNALNQEITEHVNSIAFLNINLEDYKARCTSIMDEHQTMLKEKMEIAEQLAEAKGELTGLKENLISLESRFGQQLLENQELLAEIENMKVVVKDLESRAQVSKPSFNLECVRQENIRLADLSKNLSQKLDSAIKETESLRLVIKHSSSEKEALLKEAHQLRHELQELETASNTEHIKEELLEKLEESQKELDQANAKVVSLTTQVNSLEDFLKKNEKRVEFATFSEYKSVKHCLGAIGKTEVILLERCMNKMEKELQLLKLQKKELETKVMKNASIAGHYKTKCIEYRNKYYIEVGQPENVVSLEMLRQPQLNPIQEESREESVAEMQSTSKAVIPAQETNVEAEPNAKKERIGEEIIPSRPVPQISSEVEEKSTEAQLPRVPFGKVNSPRKNPPSKKSETDPGTSASVAGCLPEPELEKPGKVNPPVRGRVTRSTTRKPLGDEDMPDNCKQQ